MKNRKAVYKITCGALMICTLGSSSCSDPGDDGKINWDSTFPTLNAVKPEKEVYKQKRSEKRGICTNWRIPTMPELLGSGVSWCYDWGHSPKSGDRKQMLEKEKIAFYPMVWNAGYGETNLRTIITENKDWNWLLGYNEPNLSDQANMTPAQAAANWPELVAVAKQLGYKIVGPAVNYGTLPGYNDPVKWYDEFIAQPNVNADDIDAIALHSYMPGAEQIKNMVRSFDKFGKPIWLTEFANGNASSEMGQVGFMSGMLDYLEADPTVEKYAWFMDNVGKNDVAPHYPLVTLPLLGSNPVDTYVTDLGLVYVNMSTLDKSTYYNVDEIIPAEHYSSYNGEASVSGNGWETGVSVRVSTDVYGTLEIYSFMENKWVEYLVDAPKTALYRFDMRYAGARDVVLTISAQGQKDKLVQLPASGANDEWTTVGVEIPLNKGKQAIRLTGNMGNGCFNWFRVTSPLN